MPKDYQRQKVYNFEIAHSLFESPLTSQREIEELIQRVWNDYQCVGPAPYVKIVPGRVRGTAFGDSFIVLGTGRQWGIRYVLHEIAHCIIANRHNNGSPQAEQRHGPEFVAMLIELRVRYAGDDVRVLNAGALSWGVLGVATETLQHLLMLKAIATPAEAKKIRRDIRKLSRAAMTAAASEYAFTISPAKPKREWRYQCSQCGQRFVRYHWTCRCGGELRDLKLPELD